MYYYRSSCTRHYLSLYLTCGIPTELCVIYVVVILTSVTRDLGIIGLLFITIIPKRTMQPISTSTRYFHYLNMYMYLTSIILHMAGITTIKVSGPILIRVCGWCIVQMILMLYL